MGDVIRNYNWLISRIGDISFYRVSDCTVTSAGEVELIFSPKEGLESVLCAISSNKGYAESFTTAK